MLSEQEIAEALHADRIVPIAVDNPHGPLGLEQLASAASRLNPAAGESPARIQRPIALKPQTWQRLDEIAETTGKRTFQHISASQVATAILEEYVTALPNVANTET
jgi:hypothetical protein